MAFTDRFQLGTTAGPPSAAECLASALVAPSGMYDFGLITLLAESDGRRMLGGWAWLLGVDAVALAATWQGNIIFWSPKHGSGYYLDTQNGRSTFVDRDLKSIFDVFLTKDGVKERVLFSDLFKEVRERVGPLQYGECYIAEPWLMFGGSGLSGTYGKGDLEVYLSLTGQTLQKTGPLGARGRTDKGL